MPLSTASAALPMGPGGLEPLRLGFPFGSGGLYVRAGTIGPLVWASNPGVLIYPLDARPRPQKVLQALARAPRLEPENA